METCPVKRGPGFNRKKKSRKKKFTSPKISGTKNFQAKIIWQKNSWCG
jgi:hypothetical protein